VSAVLQIVDSVAANPTVLLDLIDRDLVHLDAFDLGFPALDAEVVSSPAVDGASVPVAAFGPRQITVGLRLLDQARRGDGTAFVGALGALLTRDEVWLRWQADDAAGVPTFYRVLRSPQPTLADSLLRSRHAELTLTADPFGIGLPDVVVIPDAVSADPTAATNPRSFLVAANALSGDVATPVRWRLPGVSAGRVRMAVERPATTPPHSVEAWTNGTDTSTVADASGTGGNLRRTTFATPGLVTRVSAAVNPGRGRFRVLLRVRQSSATTKVNLRMKWGAFTFSRVPDTGSTQWHLVDLGVVEQPAHLSSGNGYGAPLSPNSVTMAVEVERVSGAGTLDIDYAYFLPATVEQCRADFPGVSGPTPSIVLDGPADDIYTTGSNDTVLLAPTAANTRDGTIPTLTPDTTNRVHLLYSTLSGGTEEIDSITNPVTVEGDYWPRYLYAAS
jgi:hypothetical protein